MLKDKLISELENMIKVIITSPELFHDGIDEEILSLLLQVKRYIKENE